MRYNKTGANLPSPKHRVDTTAQRRDLRTSGQKFLESVKEPGMIRFFLLGSAASMLVFPQGWPVIVPFAFAYHRWSLSGERRLPFRGPNSWEGVDYSDPHPAGNGKYQKASGILCVGSDQASREELWITNSDARRHGFVLGTTGSGKALPLDELILTKRGWVMNGDIKPGDVLFHPDGGETVVESVHPQGKLSALRFSFEDGRTSECCPDHLWEVTIAPGAGGKIPVGVKTEKKVMRAKDIAILVGGYGDSVSVSVKRIAPYSSDAAEGDVLSNKHAVYAARHSFDNLEYTPSSIGTAEQRISFFKAWVDASDLNIKPEKSGGIRISSLRASDARELKRVVWSLGGKSSTWVPKRGKTLLEKFKTALGKEVKRDPFRQINRLDLTVDFPGMETVFPNHVSKLKPDDGVRIMNVEMLDEKVEMSCIKTSRPDGLYVMSDFIVTHNTELLLGLVSQTFMWSSGFMFIDGKGSSAFYTRIWSLAKRFGREDDLRVINFTDIGADPEAPAGGPGMMSNTANPFTKGDSDQLMNILVSIMGGAGSGNDMWKDRATSLVGCLMKALVEMRNKGDIIMNVQVMREYLALGRGVDKSTIMGKKIDKVEDLPQVAWDEMRTRAGMIELYLLALKGGYFSQGTLDAIKGFFESLPGFSIDKALKGDLQDGKCNEQYNFLNMQLTKPLGTFADSFRHIFMTPFGEVDLEDVMLNRRILIVLLPALQKAESEMQNCGKVVVSLVKIMMGNADPGKLEGSRQKVRESSPTESSTPFIVVLDEVGYYMVAGIDVMMAQARSLGFMVILAGQDMAAMQKVNKELAEITSANASIFAAGKTVDAARTLEVIQKLFGKAKVSVNTGYEREQGVIGIKMIPRKDVSYDDVERVALKELQGLQPGEFYYLFDGELVRANSFYVGDFDKRIEYMVVNKFVLIRGPRDQVPNLDQTVAMRFSGGYIGALRKLYGMMPNSPSVASYNDDLNLAGVVAEKMMDKIRKTGRQPSAEQSSMAWISGVMSSVISDDIGHEDMDFDDDFSTDLSEDEINAAIRKAMSEDIEVRHRGNIDTLVAQQKVKEIVNKIPKKDPEPQPEPAAEDDSAKEFFRKISGNWDKIQKLLIEDDETTKDAMDVLRNSGNTPREAIGPEKTHRDVMDPLERMVYEEASKNLDEAENKGFDVLPDEENWFKEILGDSEKENGE